ncbi:MAG: beta-class carbonic anhydrase [Solirubrobacteraceae bacterium]
MSQTNDLITAARQRSAELACGAMDARPSRRLAVLTCMDARLDVYAILGLGHGEAHVVRNAGGLASEDAIRSLSASQRLLGTEEVIVMMHEDCGLQGASEDELSRSLAADGAYPNWRLGAFTDVEGALSASLTRLRQSPELPRRDAIRGLIFDPVTGLLRELESEGATAPPA